MRNLYKAFDECINKEEKRKEEEKKEFINKEINEFYKKIEFIKCTSDLYITYENNYLEIAKEIIDICADYKLKNNLNSEYNFRKMLYYFELNTVNMLYNRVISLYNPSMNEALISVLNSIKSYETKEIPNKLNTKEDIDLKNIIENNINEINNKIGILESENVNRRRNYEINEVRGYYAYKLFIQMLMDRLYMESINNKDENILNNDMLFTFKIVLSKTLELNKNSDTLKLPTNVEIHFIEFLKLFIERNNFKDTNISNKIPDKMTYYIKANVKDLIDACYREIQGFEYTDELVKETISEENINLNKESENPLTLKIE